jgi:glycerol uptake facilitator-like aquaporin
MFLAAAGNLYFYSGAVFNPAIGFGLQAFYALADHDPARLKYFYIYLICPFIGSTMTAFVY